MARQAVAQRGAALASALRNGQGAERPSRRADAREPGDARIIIGAGHRRFRRRQQSRRQAHPIAWRDRIPDVRGVDVDPYAGRQAEPGIGADRQTHQAARGQGFRLFHHTCEPDHRRMGEHGCGSALGMPPGEGHADRHGKRARRDRPRQSGSPVDRGRSQAQARRGEDRRPPRARIGRHEPDRDAQAQHDGQPQGQLLAFRFQPSLDPPERPAPSLGPRDLKARNARARGRRG